MLKLDFDRHNAESKKLWADFWAGKAARVPMTIGANYRMIVLDPKLNTAGHTFERIFSDPAAMIEAQADFLDWLHMNVLCDDPIGPVRRYNVGVSFLNCYDALYFGCPLHFRPGQIPDTEPWLTDGNRDALFDRDFQDEAAIVAHPWVARSIEFHEYITAQRSRWQRDRAGLGDISPAFLGNDGPFTIACAVRPPDLVMTDMVDDPGYYHQLMGTITDAVITRTRVLRRHYGRDALDTRGTGLADDACMMLSPRVYREFVLPYHRRLLDALADVRAIKAGGGRIGMHLCGDASHLFPTMVKELGINLFDTGFPIDHGQVRRELGPDVWIQGGPKVQILKDGTPSEVFAETRRILESGVKAGGRFVLREGNNLAPCTPTENIEAMYQANLQFGRLS